ncbi:MAG: bifunctional riboflavin kinase/FAD synthetase [Myxococcota bacterium]
MSRGHLVVIGNFDGVHRGHQAVLNSVCKLAGERRLKPRLLTFEPHPAVTLGRPAPALLTRLGRKVELMDRACPGIDVVVREFTREFASQSPEAFVDDILIAELDAALVMVGANFRFGRQRSGGIEELEAFGAEKGFAVIAEPLVSDDDGAWSSSRTRAHIAAGEMPEARHILGRPHMLSGPVVRGDQRGRTLGFPTCNIVDIEEALPPHGVYAALIDIVRDGRATALAPGVANLGVRPTVGDQARPQLEVHLFDFEGDLYGAELQVHLLEQIRVEQRFDGLDALRAQIDADGVRARTIVAAEGAVPPAQPWH